jgi:hypothetical protein
MLSQALATPLEDQEGGLIANLENWGYRFELPREEMLDLYEISLTANEVLLYYVLGVATVLISIVIPIVKVVKKKKKKVLL